MIPKLIISNSQSDSNMFYATEILIPDDFVYLEKNGRKTIYVDDLEYNRAIKEAKVYRVINYSKYKKGISRDTFGSILISILKDNKIKKIKVPGNFKMKYAKILMDNKIKIEIVEPFFKKRVFKNEDEIEKIRKVQRVNEKALKKSIEIIEKSKIRKDKKLSYQNKILTSEFIKEVLDMEFLKNGCVSENNIVSCGKNGADPHSFGNGPLLADQLIVIDIFPRSKTTKYFADMTRTIVKGKASLEMKKIYNAVLGAQKLALGEIKAGVRADSIHKKVQNYFENKGFKTGEKDGKIQGFFHGTGHGVGLDIHELPNISLGNKKLLKTGNVVTVEPGLYYPKIGGVRIEDLVVVTKTGCKNLTKFPKFLEIK